MPNTPMMVGEGCSVYTPGKNVSIEDIILVRQMFEISGIAQMVPENMINAVGALSGSGPAFVKIKKYAKLFLQLFLLGLFDD